MRSPLISLPDHFSNARFLRVAAALLIFASPLRAQVFEAKTETKEIALGNTFEVAFSLKDARGERFKAPEWTGFKVVGGPSEMRGMSIINGRSTSHHTWTYELEPRRAGTFAIGAASVVVDGKTLSTQPLVIKVVAARNTSGGDAPPGADDKLFITGELDRNTVWLGEQLTWRILLYTQLSLEGVDIIDIPEFEGFYSREKRRFDTRVNYRTVRGKKYAVKTLYEEALFPQESGELNIGAAQVRVGIEQPGAFGAFMGPKPVLLQTQPLRLTVKPLPGPAPEFFCGGVGQYDWQLEFDRDSLSTDDALTLRIALRGNGDSKRFAPPKLNLPPGLEVFEPKIAEEEEYENGEQLIHSKVLEYVILPKEPGEYVIRPALTFFDPDSNRFHTLSADSLPPVRISAGANYRSNQVAIDSLPPAPPARDASDGWSLARDLIQSPAFWGLLATPFVMLFLYLLLRKKRKNGPAEALVGIPARGETPAAVKTRNTAATPPPASDARDVKLARERFAQTARLLGSGNPRAFYDTLFKTLQAYLTARFGLSPAGMTQENVRKILSERGVPTATIQNLLSVWQTCEQALFAAQPQAAQMEHSWRMADSVVQYLEKMAGK